MRRAYFIFALLFLLSSICFADTILLKNGTKIEGTIVEQTDDYIIIDFMDLGTTLRYDKSNIKETIVSEKKISQKAEIINNPKYILYVPTGIDFNKKYPLVIALSPGADAQSMINTWKNVSDKYKWLILASKEFRNGIDPGPIFKEIPSITERLSIDFPIDSTKIIATGLSGGGMGAHMFSFHYPKFISAVISNVGVIHRSYIKEKAYDYPKRKLAVFLTSPSDFNYNGMKEDKIFLEGKGWKTKWIEFSGGHTMAPDSAYQEAAEWLNNQLSP